LERGTQAIDYFHVSLFQAISHSKTNGFILIDSGGGEFELGGLSQLVDRVHVGAIRSPQWTHQAFYRPFLDV
jgi:hypothetical protein